jgi:hypothetical protein
MKNLSEDATKFLSMIEDSSPRNFYAVMKGRDQLVKFLSSTTEPDERYRSAEEGPEDRGYGWVDRDPDEVTKLVNKAKELGIEFFLSPSPLPIN